MRILVIGGTRFIGPPVVEWLVSAGHEVAVFHRGQSEASLPEAVRHLHGDRQRLAQFAGEFRRFAPDVALDVAPYRQADAGLFVDALGGIAPRAVVLSSMDVYRAYGRFHGSEPGPPEPVPLDEEAPLREKLYPYRGSGRLDDYDKIPVERAVMEAPGLTGTVLRLPMLYGPGDYQHRLFFDLKRMDDGRHSILLAEDVARWRWTRGYVENVAQAISLAVTDERAAGRIYNVGEADALSSKEWLGAVGRAAGWQGDVVVAPGDRLPPHLQGAGGNVAQDLVCDTALIRRELGYRESLSREEGLRRAVEWERANRPEGKPEWFDYDAEDAALAALGWRPRPLRR